MDLENALMSSVSSQISLNSAPPIAMGCHDALPSILIANFSFLFSHSSPRYFGNLFEEWAKQFPALFVQAKPRLDT